jgi:hypothetical protein
MFASLLMWGAKLGVGTIVNKLAAAYQDKQNATTKQAEIAADERIKGLQARRDVLVAESTSPINAIVRTLFALPVAIYYGKLFLWDKVLAWGTTDALSIELQQVSWAIIGFYFVTEVTRIIRRK